MGSLIGNASKIVHPARLSCSKSIKCQLEQLALPQVGAESSRRRRPGNRPACVNQGLNKVNVTAFPVGMHPFDLKPTMLQNRSAVKIVFTLDSELFRGLHERLFPYPQYRLADYRLATADGAQIVEGIPFCELPFNLACRRQMSFC